MLGQETMTCIQFAHTHTHTHVELQAHTVHYYTYMPYTDIDMPEVFNSSDVTLSPE